MTSAEIKNIRSTLGLTQKTLAQELGCKLQTVQQWEQGIRNPGEKFGPRLAKLAKRAKKLAQLIDIGKASE